MQRSFRVLALASLVAAAMLFPTGARAALESVQADEVAPGDWGVFVPEELAIPAGESQALWITVLNRRDAPIDVRVTTDMFEYVSVSATEGATMSAQQTDEGRVTVPPGEAGSLRVDFRPGETSPPGVTWRIRAVAESAEGERRADAFVLRVAEPDALADRVAEAAMAAGIGAGVGALGWVAFSRPRLRWPAFALLAPLYARLARQDALAHEARRRIHDRAREQPGIAYNELRRELRLGSGAFVHHLRVLERAGLVVSRRVQGRRLLFPAGAAPRAPRVVSAAQRRILDALADGPRTQRELAERLGLTQQGVSYHLARLARMRAVEPEPPGEGQAARWRQAG